MSDLVSHKMYEVKENYITTEWADKKLRLTFDPKDDITVIEYHKCRMCLSYMVIGAVLAYIYDNHLTRHWRIE